MSKGARKNKVFSSIEDVPPPYCGKVSNNFVDISGDVYGKLKVLYCTGVRLGRAEWLCWCMNCGKYVIVNSHNLRSGHTRSCGCLISEALRENIEGKTFGYLKVLKYSHSYNENPYWTVECQNCGRIYEVGGDALKRGQIACGCIKSKGEMEIQKILNENKILFKREVSFDDLRGKGGNKLRFDFGVYFSDGSLSHLIEMQGIQHYKRIYGVDEETFEYRKALDVRKRNYCKEHNIPLIEIYFKENITLDKLLVFRTRGYQEESLSQYKKPSFFISNTVCNGFKCDKENGNSYCINSHLMKENIKTYQISKLIDEYSDNKITEAIVFGGLENLDEFDQLLWFVKSFRTRFPEDDIVVYTGFNPEEKEEEIRQLAQFKNVIIKYGRFRPGDKPHEDPVLGVPLASDNQYAIKIS